MLNGETLVLATPGAGPFTGEGIQETIESGETGNYPNIYLWQAVDKFKEQGYTVTSIMLSGQGTQGNPHQFFVVLSK